MQQFNFYERMMLLLGYKPGLMLNLTGSVLCQVFLSEHQLIPALAIQLISFTVAIAIAWKQDLQKLAEKTIGKIMLSQARPVNLIFCITGLIVFYYGIWLDDYIFVAAGGIIAFASSRWHARKVKSEVSK